MKVEDMTFEWVSGHQIKPYSTIGIFRNRKYKKVFIYYDKYLQEFYNVLPVGKKKKLSLPRKVPPKATIRMLQLAAFPEDVPWWKDDATHWRYTNG